MDSPFFGKSAATIGTLMVLLAVPYTNQSLARFRVFTDPAPKRGSNEAAPGASATAAAMPSASVGELTLNSSEQRGSSQNALPSERKVESKGKREARPDVLVEQPEALGPFFSSLMKTDAEHAADANKAAVTRILHYGDSVITSDYISGSLRRRFQDRFGDAGHGFLLTAKAWEWYFHNDVSHYASEGWNSSRVSGPFNKEAAYGLGGAVFRGSPGATATFGTTTRGDYGRKLGVVDVYYEALESGGDFELKSPGQEAQVVHTKDDHAHSAKATYRIPDGETKVTLRVLGKGEVRVYGASLERDRPGVVYDALGALGARAKMWEPVAEEHWRQQLTLREPHLVVLQFGTNESEDGSVAKDYEASLTALVEKLKRAAPKASVLIASPLDRAEREGGRTRSVRALVKIVEIQERVAKATKVAFYNSWKAMGGEGSMGKWLNHKPQLCSGDLTHPTPAGAEVMGDLMYRAILDAYEEHKEKPRSSP
jgi:lysophospholipase L1-like esterase